MIRKMPSAPDLSRTPTSTPTSIRDRYSKRPVSKSDPRLDRVKTADWGITFLNDADFRKIITSYLVWEHPVWGLFNTDDFCNALAGEESDLSSKLLVYAVLAVAAVCLVIKRISGNIANGVSRGPMYISIPNYRQYIFRHGNERDISGRRPSTTTTTV